MKVFKEIAALKTYLTEQNRLKSIGFVPTMGALHKGHISLIQQAKAENGCVVSSIFVNPTQFNDPKDLEKYPRPIETDKQMLIDANCDVLFLPSVEEIYPEEQMAIGGPLVGQLGWNDINLGALDKVMEAAQRPGHFKGVVQVVSRLFDIVEPDKAYFGQKDFQQLAVIREMTKQLNYNIEIIACPIVREPDGLAMSSRNIRLTADERNLAPLIYKTLVDVKKKIEDGKWEMEGLIDYASKQIRLCKEMQLEYFEIVDANTLLPVANWNNSPSIVACIAVKLGQIRLIDNIVLK